MCDADKPAAKPILILWVSGLSAFIAGQWFQYRPNEWWPGMFWCIICVVGFIALWELLPDDLEFVMGFRRKNQKTGDKP